MPSRNVRVIRTELLANAPPEAGEASLRDLVRINAWFGGHRTILRLFDPLAGRNDHFSVLDVGAASGDMGAALRRRFPEAVVTSLDCLPNHLRRAAGRRVAADAFHLPFRDRSFDFVMCSLFLHHFSDPDAVELLACFRRLARRAVVVLDLERHLIARRFMPATWRVFGWSRISLHDGPASVDAAFVPEELAALARRAGAPHVIVRRHRPWFRVSAVLAA